jgi:hypothetical protein
MQAGRQLITADLQKQLQNVMGGRATLSSLSTHIGVRRMQVSGAMSHGAA